MGSLRSSLAKTMSKFRDNDIVDIAAAVLLFSLATIVFILSATTVYAFVDYFFLGGR